MLKCVKEIWGSERRKFADALFAGKITLMTGEAISKLLKIVKAPSLRSDKGRVFPPSHKATAGEAPVTLQAASANYTLYSSLRFFCDLRNW